MPRGRAGLTRASVGDDAHAVSGALELTDRGLRRQQRRRAAHAGDKGPSSRSSGPVEGREEDQVGSRPPAGVEHGEGGFCDIAGLEEALDSAMEEVDAIHREEEGEEGGGGGVVEAAVGEEGEAADGEGGATPELRARVRSLRHRPVRSSLEARALREQLAHARSRLSAMHRHGATTAQGRKSAAVRAPCLCACVRHGGLTCPLPPYALVQVTATRAALEVMEATLVRMSRLGYHAQALASGSSADAAHGEGVAACLREPVHLALPGLALGDAGAKVVAGALQSRGERLQELTPCVSFAATLSGLGSRVRAALGSNAPSATPPPPPTSAHRPRPLPLGPNTMADVEAVQSRAWPGAGLACPPLCVDLSDNGIGDAGAAALAAAVRKCGPLARLELRRNDIGPRGGLALLQVRAGTALEAVAQRGSPLLTPAPPFQASRAQVLGRHCRQAVSALLDPFFRVQGRDGLVRQHGFSPSRAQRAAVERALVSGGREAVEGEERRQLLAAVQECSRNVLQARHEVERAESEAGGALGGGRLQVLDLSGTLVSRAHLRAYQDTGTLTPEQERVAVRRRGGRTPEQAAAEREVAAEACRCVRLDRATRCVRVCVHRRVPGSRCAQHRSSAVSARASQPLVPGEGVDPALVEAAEAQMAGTESGEEEEGRGEGGEERVESGHDGKEPTHGTDSSGARRPAGAHGTLKGRSPGGGGTKGRRPSGGKTRLRARVQSRRGHSSDSAGDLDPAPPASASTASAATAQRSGPLGGRSLRRQPSVSGMIDEPRPWEQTCPSTRRRGRQGAEDKAEAIPPQARIVLMRPGSTAALKRLQRGSSLARGLRAMQQLRARSGAAAQGGEETDPSVGVAMEAFGPEGLPGRGSPLEEATPTPTATGASTPVPAPTGTAGGEDGGARTKASAPSAPPPDSQLDSEADKLRERRAAPTNSPVRRSASVQVLQARGPKAAGEASPPPSRHRDADGPWRAGVAPYRLAGATPLSGKRAQRTEARGGAGKERKRPTSAHKAATQPPRDKARGTPSVVLEVLDPGSGGGRRWGEPGGASRRAQPAGGFPVLPASALMSEESPSALAKSLRPAPRTGGGGTRRRKARARRRPRADEEGEGDGSEDSLDMEIGAEGALPSCA